MTLSRNLDIEEVLLSQAKLLQVFSPLEELLRFRIDEHFSVDYVLLVDRTQWILKEGPLVIRIKHRDEITDDHKHLTRQVIKYTLKQINMIAGFRVEWDR